MKYKEITLKAANQDDVVTEIMFEIACARADKVEVLRLNILCYTSVDDSITSKKISTQAKKTLRSMKLNGQIQFFATEDSFIDSSTEAVFLINKYPELFTNTMTKSSVEESIYIKI